MEVTAAALAAALVAASAVALSKSSVHLNQAVTMFLTLIPMVHVMEVLDSLME